MYQTLYRKYRPSYFDDVVGQEIIKTTLINAINNNKISHAYIFEGPRGTGKTSLAKIFAKTINCLDLKDNKPCNKCVSCTQMQNNSSMDIMEIDAASCNSVDNVREIINNADTLPTYSKYKIYIIDEVHMFSIGAFNALLKTLEEPPQHVIFILATTDSQKIPATIISRCQVFNFKKISNENIFLRLKYISKEEKINITDDALKTIADFSDGGLRDAIGMLDQVISYKSNDIDENDVHQINGTLSNKEIESFVNCINDKNLNDILNKIDSYNNDGKNLVQIVLEIINYLKYCLFNIIAPKYMINLGIDSNKYKISLNKEDLIQLTNKFNNIYQKIRNSSDIKLSLELELISILTNENNEVNKKIDKINIESNKKEEKIVKKNNDNLKIDNKNIKIEVKKEIVDINEPYIINNLDFFNQLKEIRINNTLAGFDKKTFKFLKENIMMINSLLIDKKYADLCSLILDGKIKATSNDSIIFVFDDESDVSRFNTNLIDIETILNDTYNVKYRVIGLSNKEWEPYKNDFNNKKQFEYIEELIDYENIFGKEKKTNKIEENFKGLIEEE